MNKIAREKADLYQDFFNFLSQEHNLTCTIEEMDEIIHEAQAFVKKFDIANVSKRNWFEKLPLHWRYIYYMVGGIVIGYLLHYVC